MEPIGGGVPWCSSSQLESTWLLPSVQDEVVMATDSHSFSSSPGPHTAQHPYPAPALRGVTETGALPAESHLPYAPVSHSPHLQLPKWGLVGLIWQLAHSCLRVAPRNSASSILTQVLIS